MQLHEFNETGLANRQEVLGRKVLGRNYEFYFPPNVGPAVRLTRTIM
jgi:hypothetical protein